MKCRAAPILLFTTLLGCSSNQAPGSLDTIKSQARAICMQEQTDACVRTFWDYEKETGATLMDLRFRPMWKQCPDFAAKVCRSR